MDHTAVTTAGGTEGDQKTHVHILILAQDKKECQKLCQHGAVLAS